jgi:hypothetical protein
MPVSAEGGRQVDAQSQPMLNLPPAAFERSLFKGIAFMLSRIVLRNPARIYFRRSPDPEQVKTALVIEHQLRPVKEVHTLEVSPSSQPKVSRQSQQSQAVTGLGLETQARQACTT